MTIEHFPNTLGIRVRDMVVKATFYKMKGQDPKPGVKKIQLVYIHHKLQLL